VSLRIPDGRFTSRLHAGALAPGPVDPRNQLAIVTYLHASTVLGDRRQGIGCYATESLTQSTVQPRSHSLLVVSNDHRGICFSVCSHSLTAELV
jgi:hypothetical protein